MTNLDSIILSRVERQLQTIAHGRFKFSIYTRKNPHKQSSNEDSIGYIRLDEEKLILVVADGLGGHPHGDQASNIVLISVLEKLQGLQKIPADDPDNQLRNAILNGIEKANEALISAGQGAKTTVTVCEISGHSARCYQVGDSELIICGQRGRLKYKTTSHSPVGYGVEAGLITEKAALSHPDRHYISNVVGESEMKIEIGPRILLNKHDTILLGSDGLFDNFSHDDLVNQIRIGPLENVLLLLESKLDRKISESIDNSTRAKYDDVSFIVGRRNPSP